MQRTVALILAAGMGTRMGNVSKARLAVCGIPALSLTMLAFEKSQSIDGIIVAARADELSFAEKLARDYGITKFITAVAGGESRMMSAKNALEATPSDFSFIAVHDGARVLTSPDDIDKVVSAAFKNLCATSATKVTDTQKASDGRFILSTVDRKSLYAVQTPQVFSKELYEKAIKKAIEDGGEFTDDCSMLECIGQKISLVECSKTNIKLTTPEDVFLAEAIFEKRGGGMKVGHGYDVHALCEGRELILGGVKIPHEKGLMGHSDADVLLHAVMDSLLGACALGDIGKHFPPTDDAYKGISSLKLLANVASLINGAGFRVQNIDATVVCQRPRLAPYIDAMRENIASTLGISTDTVSVKATTEEHLGFTGREEGIAAHCICSVIKIS